MGRSDSEYKKQIVKREHPSTDCKLEKGRENYDHVVVSPFVFAISAMLNFSWSISSFSRDSPSRLQVHTVENDAFCDFWRLWQAKFGDSENGLYWGVLSL